MTPRPLTSLVAVRAADPAVRPARHGVAHVARTPGRAAARGVNREQRGIALVQDGADLRGCPPVRPN